jgi:hypothetical protein
MHPFNLGTYRQMLLTLKTERRVIKYSEISHHHEFVLWRHDCDMSLNRALVIAELDSQYGVQSTFFINPHSEFYNIFEQNQTKIIREILNLGHDIGIHFDSSYHMASSEKYDIEEALAKDARYLQDVAETLLRVFSFHNPSSEDLAFDERIYTDLINCYSKEFRSSINYGSDSNGYWRYQPIPEIIQDQSKKKMQILTHPEWWLDEDYLPRDRVLRCVYGRALYTVAEYDRVLEKHSDRENQKPNGKLNDYERAIKLL